MNTHTLTLTPTDTLFFKDGRPMEGASLGHGAAWPMPHILDSALHHALKRANLGNVHRHRTARNGEIISEDRDKQGKEFGSLQTAGAFPIVDGTWFFARPADADHATSADTTHRPLTDFTFNANSSLIDHLAPVVNTQPPSKEKTEPWFSQVAYQAYLEKSNSPESHHFLFDETLFSAEHSIGIQVDPNTQSTVEGAFYSASYLRLAKNTKIGLLAQCLDKGQSGTIAEHDLIQQVFPNGDNSTNIIAGGQQRVCSVKRTSESTLPLPKGSTIKGKLVRWTLLTPAIYPQIASNQDKKVIAHPGGSLPSWINATDHSVQLKDISNSARHPGECRKKWRERVASLPPLAAKLVAANIPKAQPVTGWSLLHCKDSNNPDDGQGGAKASHLAIPAGAVFYFEAESEQEAQKLADALNWHGTSSGSEIQNRRSSLLGEKGYGLGVCSPWTPHQA